LPEVSWVFPPGDLQEHSPNAPNDGAWFMNELVYAAINGKNRDDTVMLINYDGEFEAPVIPDV
jgi:phospholipase C